MLISCGSPVVDNCVFKSCGTQTLDRSSHIPGVVEYANSDGSYSCHLQEEFEACRLPGRFVGQNYPIMEAKRPLRRQTDQTISDDILIQGK